MAADFSLESGGVLVVGILFVLENVGSKYREFAGNLALLPDGFTEVILSGIAYYSTTWRMYLFTYSLLSIYILLIVFVVPETPRWLLSKGKADAAVKILTRAAKWYEFISMKIQFYSFDPFFNELFFRNRMSTDRIKENISKAIDEMKPEELRKEVSYNE